MSFDKALLSSTISDNAFFIVETPMTMKTLLILALLLSSLTFTECANAKYLHLGSVQKTQSQDADEFLNRWKDPKHWNLFTSATWTLTHDYSDFKHMEEVLKTVQSYFEALGKYEQGDHSLLDQMGGVKAFKDKLSGWLNDDDQAVRAYAAVMLGISGDKLYAPQLANLLKERKYKDTDLLHYDRGRAAMALGLVGANEYIPNLVILLKSSNEYDRAGATYGLGLLKAKAHAKAVAKLLNDKAESVREAAKESLEMMGAAELIKGKKAGKPQ